MSTGVDVSSSELDDKFPVDWDEVEHQGARIPKINVSQDEKPSYADEVGVDERIIEKMGPLTPGFMIAICIVIVIILIFAIGNYIPPLPAS